MKINEPQSIQPTPAPQRAVHHPQKPGGASFQDALQQAVARSGSGPSTEPSTAAVLAAPAPASIKPIESSSVGQFVDKIDRMLDTLDAYRQQLADHRCTLRDIEPLLNQIENGNRQLTAMQAQLPENNPLHGIVQDLLVTASLEVVKFNRGDYV